MSVLPRLTALYRARGFTLAGGLNPAHVDGLRTAPFTWLLRDGAVWTNGLGIAPQEVHFLETVTAALAPRRLLVIGNSFGWSSLALALAAGPQARVVALDSGDDPRSLEGLEMTRAMAEEAGVTVVPVQGRSPDAVPEAVAAHLEGGLVDFALVDGFHANEQIVADFQALRPYLAPAAAVAFHDVVECGLEPGFSRICAEWAGPHALARGTPSGMGLLWTAAAPPAVAEATAAFTPDPEALPLLRREAWNRRHPTLARWRRSLAKRRARLARLRGGQG